MFIKQTSGRTQLHFPLWVTFYRILGDCRSKEMTTPLPSPQRQGHRMPLRAVENPEAGADVSGARGSHFPLVDQRHELRHTLVL